MNCANSKRAKKAHNLEFQLLLQLRERLTATIKVKLPRTGDQRIKVDFYRVVNEVPVLEVS